MSIDVVFNEQVFPFNSNQENSYMQPLPSVGNAHKLTIDCDDVFVENNEDHTDDFNHDHDDMSNVDSNGEESTVAQILAIHPMRSYCLLYDVQPGKAHNLCGCKIMSPLPKTPVQMQ